MKLGSGVQAVGDGENKKGKEREGNEKKRYYKKAQKCYIPHPCSEGSKGAISTKFGTVVDQTYVITYTTFGWYRLKGGYISAVQNLPFSHEFIGWPTTGKH